MHTLNLRVTTRLVLAAAVLWLVPAHGPLAASKTEIDIMDEANRICDAQTKLKELELFTVHIMGTARMGAKPQDSVIDLDGQVWDLPGCYVADASVFPTAIGVNPQITIMAIASRVATRLADKALSKRSAA